MADPFPTSGTADKTPSRAPRKRGRKAAGRGNRVRLPIAAVLVAGFGSLMLLAVASVLVLGLVSASRNTFALLNDRADLVLSGVEVRVRNQLNPARDMARFVAGLMERGELDPSDETAMEQTLRGALAGAPDVTGIGFVRPDHTGVRASRLNSDLRVGPVEVDGRETLSADIMKGADRTTAVWTDPLWSKEAGTTFITLRQPVRYEGRYLGQVVVGVSLGDLSRFLSTLYVDQGQNAFVLFDPQHVLAHPSLAGMKFDFSDKDAGPPLPRIDQVDDPALAELWTAGEPIEALKLKRNIQGRTVTVLGEDYLFLMRTMSGYGTHDWTIGVRFRASEVGTEVLRLYTTAAAGLGILLVSVGVALFVGRRISAQVARLADAAERVGAFEFRDFPELPDSHLRELAHANRAFNAMVSGLRWFETYVPKSLVLRLMHRRGRDTALRSEERNVTVMFTDIRGFSQMAAHLGAAETAALLNEHFTQLANCIEAEGGTVDKFIGDAIMAFWGAPDEQPDHAARALRAAHAIGRAVHAGNEERAARGLPPIRVRIGMHSGPVVVGNIGSESRINYTIVGDTVNIAARIEELASSLQGDAEVIVLASAATAFLGDGATPLDCLGGHPLRGRTISTEVWRVALDIDAELAAEKA